MKPATVLVVAPPREAGPWEQALRARGLEVVRATGRREAARAARTASPAAAVVSEKLPFAGALRVTRELRFDPATREAPVVLVGLAPFTTSQRLRLGASAPDATVAKGASPEAVAEAAMEAMRRGKVPPPELTPQQQAAMRYSRFGTILMMMGVVFAFSPRQASSGFDRAWFVLLVPLGGIVSDITTGRVDGRRRWLGWQGWAAVGCIAILALGILFLPRIFRFG